MSKNLVILIGNLGANPDVKVFDDGGKLARLNVATSESYTNQQGDKITSTEWHTVICHGKLAELAEKYLEKGKRVAIEGKLKTRKYNDSNSVERYVTEIIAREITFL